MLLLAAGAKFGVKRPPQDNMIHMRQLLGSNSIMRLLILAIILLSFPVRYLLVYLDTTDEDTVIVRDHSFKGLDADNKKILVEEHEVELKSKLKEYGRIWIDVTSFAEGIAGWRTSLMEILQLAQAINATIVEPCMTNGRLGSCFDRKVPVSEIFDLSEAMKPSFDDDRHIPLMASYDDYREFRVRIASSGSAKFQQNICFDPHNWNTRRCSAGSQYTKNMNATKFRIELMDSKKYAIAVLQLEDYWRGTSIGKLKKLFRVELRTLTYKLPFHRQHVETVEDVLRKSNVLTSPDDAFSAIHWRAEKPGMDFMECAKAIQSTKKSMLEKIDANSTDQGEGRRHSFVLISSLNKDPDMMWTGSRRVVAVSRQSNNTANHALDYLLQDNGFLKVDDLLKQTISIADPGMLAVYDLILAIKATHFATCARDGVHGCSVGNSLICQKCNHVGKFGKLAISMRQISSLLHNDTGGSSWECWPQTEE